jgi:hypothetical protein
MGSHMDLNGLTESTPNEINDTSGHTAYYDKVYKKYAKSKEMCQRCLMSSVCWWSDVICC